MRKMTSTIIGITGFAITVLSYFYFFHTPTIQKESISIAVSHTPLSAPFYIAENLNLFHKNGLEVKLVDIHGGHKSFVELSENRVDYATSSESVLMFASMKGQPFSLLATFVESDNDIKLLYHKERGINAIADLKGKKLGLVKGSASEYFASLLLGLHGLKITDVTLVNLSANKMHDAIKTGKVDAISGWEPYMFKIAKSLGSSVDIFNTKNLHTLYFNLITKKDLNLDSFEKNKRLLMALKEAIQFIYQHPNKAQEIVKNKLSLKDDFIEWIWPDNLYKLSLNRSLILTIKNEALWATQTGLVKIKKKPNFRLLVDDKPLSEIGKSAVNL